MKNGIKKKESYNIIAYYKPNENDEKKVKVLDIYFIKKNRNKCKIKYKNKIFELKEYFEDIDINYNHKDLIKLKLIFIHNIIDMSYMFYNCDSLISLSDCNEINPNLLKQQIYINNISYMLFGCNKLISLPEISEWNTSNVKDMSHTFDGCESLISLPDISKWITSKVNNMSYMFEGCESLVSLPDISKWNTSNVKNMNYMFNKCKSSLKILEFYILNKRKNNIIFEITYKNRKNKEEGKVKILGKEFIDKNKDKGIII